MKIKQFNLRLLFVLIFIAAVSIVLVQFAATHFPAFLFIAFIFSFVLALFGVAFIAVAGLIALLIWSARDGDEIKRENLNRCVKIALFGFFMILPLCLILVIFPFILTD